MEIIIGILALVITVIALAYQLRDRKKLPKFKGPIGSSTKEDNAFINFIHKNEDGISHQQDILTP